MNGIICPDGWDKTDADVLCRQIGYSGGGVAFGPQYSGKVFVCEGTLGHPAPRHSIILLEGRFLFALLLHFPPGKKLLPERFDMSECPGELVWDPLWLSSRFLVNFSWTRIFLISSYTL